MLFGLGSLFGSGTRVDYVDAFATGRGNAFSATADNPSAIYYNPAGITQLEGVQGQVGTYMISLDYSVEQANGTVKMDDSWQFLPNLFATYNMENTPAAFGLGIYAPFGLSTDWPDDSPFFGVADKSELKYITVHPVMAWQINDTFSIGGGPTINSAEFTFDQRLAGFNYNGNAVSLGFVLSALWIPVEQHSFSILYRSRADSKTTGSAVLPVPGVPAPFEVAGSAEFPFPDCWRFGYSFRPSPKWNFEANFEWMNWDVLQTVDLTTEVQTIPFVFNWDSSWFYEFGGSYFLDNGYHISGGFAWVENSIPDATFTPIVPDSDRYFVSLGVGHRGDRWSWDGVVQYGAGSRDVVAPSVPGFDFGGKYETNSLAFNLSLAYQF